MNKNLKPQHCFPVEKKNTLFHIWIKIRGTNMVSMLGSFGYKNLGIYRETYIPNNY